MYYYISRDERDFNVAILLMTGWLSKSMSRTRFDLQDFCIGAVEQPDLLGIWMGYTVIKNIINIAHSYSQHPTSTFIAFPRGLKQNTIKAKHLFFQTPATVFCTAANQYGAYK